MKIQTSIEFLLILSAVSILSLTLISAYKSNMIGAKHVINFVSSNQLNLTYNYSVGYAQHPGILINVPINSTAEAQNKIDVIFYGCLNGTGSVKFSSNTLIFSQNDIQGNLFENIGMLTITFYPMTTGQNKIYVNYSVACGNLGDYGNATFFTYSATQNLSKTQDNTDIPIYASINNRNESLLYSISMQDTIKNISQSSHCTRLDFWYKPYPVWIQCGTSDAWDYYVWSDSCYWNSYTPTQTYCVIPKDSNISVYSTSSSNISYLYSFALLLYSNSFKLSANVTNSGNSTLLDDGRFAGRVYVKNITGIENYQPAYFAGDSRNKTVVNASLYQEYIQARNNMYAMLSYYNNTEVSPSTASAIQQSIEAYEIAARDLIESSGTKPQTCNIISGNYICKALYPFSYILNVETNSGLKNQTIYYAGSVINVIK